MLAQDRRGLQRLTPRPGSPGCGRRGLIAKGVQILEHAPEDHPPIIPAADALNEGESSLDALMMPSGCWPSSLAGDFGVVFPPLSFLTKSELVPKARRGRHSGRRGILFTGNGARAARCP
jgi:hypothetical protein